MSVILRYYPGGRERKYRRQPTIIFRDLMNQKERISLQGGGEVHYQFSSFS